MAKAPENTEKEPTPAEPVEDAVVIEDVPAEPVVKDETQPDEAPEAVAAEPHKAKRGGFGVMAGLLLGGAAAAIIGFAAARYVVPEGWPFPGVPPEVDPLVAVTEAQAAEIAALSARLDAMRAEIDADVTAKIAGPVDALGARIDALDTVLSGIETRLVSVEKLAPEGSAAARLAAEAYERELAGLRKMFEGQLARVEAASNEANALEVSAAAAARVSAGRAALARVVAALETGHPFGDALSDLTEAAGVDAPDGLAKVAAEGVPTLPALRESFPDAARAALDASIRAAVAEGSMDRFTAFMRTQLGTRSLEPKEGDDPDAILSRVEGALRQGDLAAALEELSAMPEAAGPALAAWKTQAEARLAAVAASRELAVKLNGE